MSATATILGGAACWGVLWRLAGLPCWTFAVWTTPSLLPSATAAPSTGTTIEPSPSTPAFAIYDAAGTVIGRFPR